ncbi:glycoside hydrolase, family 38 [Staphylothermus marinus F1]|uniref:Glycoside hydrolase, family 38 n=1 Tax=Staphylothermus marinus (strain ATCC 43588 / DSM 3639 / JCM 9404 / F1) TaxID=399550 RepID=A3DNM7_STAMF|nr:glycoside hydrolase family 38 C-terminal domain-containing protein [Staphylothermus marinus]ABN70237.1 glycoside hydrolase, family 38 [Staphylothermus marinus F1]
MDIKVFLTGYSHIDSEWLWPLEESLRVVNETFSQVINLMEKYNDLFFVTGSSLYYEYVEKNDNVLFNKIKHFVERGRWELSGGFIEFDANMASGESIVRQLVMSQKYFYQHFNKYAEILFLPDSFGFPSSLPQLLRKSRIKYFVTSKLRWNDTNDFSYPIFIWRSNDGSKVLAYITPLDYNEFLTNYGRIIFVVYEQLRKQEIPAVLIIYGKGDHGGGIDEDTIKNIIEWRRRKERFISINPSRIRDFFKYVEKHYTDKLPIYIGELYLEFHRGTYTVGSFIKKLNRYNEELLLSIEKLYTILNILFNIEYPSIVEKFWRLLLINQGHDALSATLSPNVYIEVRTRAYMLFKQLLKLYRRGLDKILEKTNGKYVLFNPNNFPLTTYMRVRGSIEGIFQDLGDNEKLVYVRNIPPLGFKVINSFNDIPSDAVKINEDKDFIFLENNYLKIIIDKKKCLVTNIFDKRLNLNILRKPIRLRMYSDLPMPTRGRLFAAGLFDAWETYYLDGLNKYLYKDLEPVEVEIKHRGPLYASVYCRYIYKQWFRRGYADISAEIGLYADKPYVEIYLDMIWRTKHKMLKLLIPLNIDSETAVFEAPYGVIERKDPLRSSDPFDKAKYEVPGHSWVDVSNGEFGVSIITDSKYGYSWMNGAIGVSLLRSPLFPIREAYAGYVEEYRHVQNKMLDLKFSKLKGLTKKILNFLLMINTYLSYLRFSKRPLYMDQGRRTARIWIYPHKGTYVEGKTYRVARELLTIHMLGYKNNSANKNTSISVMNVEPDNIVITTVKQLKPGKILLRVYNPINKTIIACLRTSFKYNKVYETDFLGNTLNYLEEDNGCIKLCFKPYEVKTIIFT